MSQQAGATMAWEAPTTTSTATAGGVGEGVSDELKARGHHVHRGPNGGGYQSIMFDHEQNSYIGATEMRKDGVAAGY